MTSVDIRAKSSTGAITGYVGSGNIHDCRVSGTVSGGNNTGGIAGSNLGTVKACVALNLAVEGKNDCGSLSDNGAFTKTMVTVNGVIKNITDDEVGIDGEAMTAQQINNDASMDNSIILHQLPVLFPFLPGK